MIDLAPNISETGDGDMAPSQKQKNGNFFAVEEVCMRQKSHDDRLGGRASGQLAVPLNMKSVTPDQVSLLGTSPSGETEFVSKAVASMSLALAGLENLKQERDDTNDSPRPRAIKCGVRRLQGNNAGLGDHCVAKPTSDAEASSISVSDMGSEVNCSIPVTAQASSSSAFLPNVTAPHSSTEIHPTSPHEFVESSPMMVSSSVSFAENSLVAAAYPHSSSQNSPQKSASTAPASSVEPIPPSPSESIKSPAAVEKQARLTAYAVRCLSVYGFCVIDGFMGARVGAAVLRAVRAADLREAGRVVASERFEEGAVRGDRVAWMDGVAGSPVDALVRRLDGMLMGVGEALGNYRISSRTKAMLACYPGTGKGYARHVDNHRQDGRLLTCIYYLNENYNPDTDGGLLRLYPSQLQQSVDVEPRFDRLVFFWSDQRTPHEVLPAHRERYAITLWYFDDIERQQARRRMMEEGAESRSISPISVM